MKIAIGNDHGAVDYKKEIVAMLEKQGHVIVNCGTDDTKSCDYTDYAIKVAHLVAGHEVDYGIVMCGTGIGISIAANKVNGIRCALCTDTTMARLTREHNDANILSLGQRIVGIELAKDIVNTFLTTEFSRGSRHLNRIMKISSIEKDPHLHR